MPELPGLRRLDRIYHTNNSIPTHGTWTSQATLSLDPMRISFGMHALFLPPGGEQLELIKKQRVPWKLIRRSSFCRNFLYSLATMTMSDFSFLNLSEPQHIGGLSFNLGPGDDNTQPDSRLIPDVEVSLFDESGQEDHHGHRKTERNKMFSKPLIRPRQKRSIVVFGTKPTIQARHQPSPTRCIAEEVNAFNRARTHKPSTNTTMKENQTLLNTP